MPLTRLQSTTVARLATLGLLQQPHVAALEKIEGQPTMESFETLLATDYAITPLCLHIARMRGMGILATSMPRGKVTAKTFEHIPMDYCAAQKIIPMGVLGEYLLIHAGADHFTAATDLRDEIKGISNLTPLFIAVPSADIETRLKKLTQPSGNDGGAELKSVLAGIADEFGHAEVEEDSGENLGEDSGPVVAMASKIIEDAYFQGASDIHLSPQEKELVVRFRVDGGTREYLRLPRKFGPSLIARIKIMCNLDISERRLPQDGRIVFKQFTKKSLDIDLRVSTAPLNHGEGAVMRILDKQKSTLPLPQLGFSDENLATYRDCIRQPYGMILHCGPTGSGKSMTLYSALGEINTPDMVIRTAEDPIEYTLPNLDQMQMHRQIGLTFASALRAFLRQDPDVILVGEIRDQETAGIAIEAALTGHLLLSTLHTNDAPSTVARLTDMGIEPFMISSSLICVCSQRLMRRLCKVCKEEVQLEGNAAQIMERAVGWSGKVFKARAKGCPACGSSGYKGRVGIHELLTASEELTSAINKEADTATLKGICMRNGMKTLHQDSMLKVKMGLTSMEEALGTVPIDMELQQRHHPKAAHHESGAPAQIPDRVAEAESEPAPEAVPHA